MLEDQFTGVTGSEDEPRAGVDLLELDDDAVRIVYGFAPGHVLRHALVIVVRQTFPVTAMLHPNVNYALIPVHRDVRVLDVERPFLAEPHHHRRVDLDAVMNRYLHLLVDVAVRCPVAEFWLPRRIADVGIIPRVPPR